MNTSFAGLFGVLVLVLVLVLDLVLVLVLVLELVLLHVVSVSFSFSTKFLAAAVATPWCPNAKNSLPTIECSSGYNSDTRRGQLAHSSDS